MTTNTSSSGIIDREEIPNEIEYVGTGTRFAHYLIDIIIFYGVMFLIGVFMALIGFGDWLIENENGLVIQLMPLPLFFLYYFLFEGYTGRTPGKWIMRTRVVTEDGLNPGWKHILKRSRSRLVPFEPLSALGGYPWHDRWSETVVTRIRK